MAYDIHIVGPDELPYEDVYMRVVMPTMTSLVRLMYEFGMLATSYGRDDVPTDRFYDDYEQARQARITAGLPVSDDEDTEWWQSEEHRALRHWRPTSPDPVTGEEMPQWGIAVHKLSSNDFWHVEATECCEALESWRVASAQASSTGREPHDLVASRVPQAGAAMGEELVKFWFEWLAFLGRGARWDGFEVH